MKEILVYALAAGETERYMETLLSTQCKNEADIEKIKARAGADGFHSFRVTGFIVGTVPNFAGTL